MSTGCCVGQGVLQKSPIMAETSLGHFLNYFSLDTVNLCVMLPFHKSIQIWNEVHPATVQSYTDGGRACLCPSKRERVASPSTHKPGSCWERRQDEVNPLGAPSPLNTGDDGNLQCPEMLNAAGKQQGASVFVILCAAEWEPRYSLTYWALNLSQ